MQRVLTEDKILSDINIDDNCKKINYVRKSHLGTNHWQGNTRLKLLQKNLFSFFQYARTCAGESFICHIVSSS